MAATTRIDWHENAQGGTIVLTHVDAVSMSPYSYVELTPEAARDLGAALLNWSSKKLAEREANEASAEDE